METNIIYNGDCLDILGTELVPENSIDLIVTSPPYNVGIEYDDYNDNLSKEEYFEWCYRWLSLCKKVLKPDGRMAVNIPIEVNRPNRILFVGEFYNMAIKAGLGYAGCPTWSDNHRPKNSARGTYLKADNPYIYSPFEVVMLLYKHQWKKIEPGETTISKKDFIYGTNGVWGLRPETQIKFPVPFPVELPRLCIELLTYKNDIVLDPFIGSGTTAVACVRTNRQYIGIEISKKWTEYARKRVSSEARTII